MNGVITGADNIDAAKELQFQLIQILESAGRLIIRPYLE